MVCQGCQTWAKGWLCGDCTGELRSARDRVLAGGIRLIGAFEHQGAARALAHHLKYRGITTYADLVADVLAERLEPAPLTPVPRSMSRRIRYGVDPAREIAKRLGRRLGAPVWELLRAPLHSERRAGGDHARPAPTYRLVSAPPYPVILVDDVVTTGATLLSAAGALGESRVRLAVAGNLVPEVTSLLPPVSESVSACPQS